MHQQKYVLGILVGIVAVLLAGCGSNYSSSTRTGSTPVTGIKKRVLVSNVTPIGGGVLIVDAQKNVFAGVSATGVPATVGVSQPSKMVTAGGQTVLLDSTTPQITVFNNNTEQVTGSATMQGQPFDIAISPDGLTGYAAIRNVGVVEVINTTSANLVGTVNVPSPARLVEGHSGHKLLVFSENPQVLPAPNTNAFFVIDTGTNTVAPVTVPGLDQPFTAVFDPSDANDTTAFILNCGPECGGTTASVIRVNFSNPSSPTFSTAIPVFGATVGLLSGSNLFVAGTPPAPPPMPPATPCTLAACGTLQVINTGSLTAGNPINITNGTHGVMAMTSNNRLYIGAAGCSVGPVSAQNTVQSCLSVFDTGSAPGATNPVVPPVSSFRQNFDVTGLQPISAPQQTIYVVQGGEMDIFDINTSLPSTTITQLDVNGKALDVVQIDP